MKKILCFLALIVVFVIPANAQICTDVTVQRQHLTNPEWLKNWGNLSDICTAPITAKAGSTIAGNPALLANQWTVGTTGIIFEGLTANNLETLITVTDPTADRTITFPDKSGTVAMTTDLPVNPGVVSVNRDFTANGTTLFNTIKAAVDYVTLQSPAWSAPWIVQVYGGGVYSESNFDVPTGVDVVGMVGSGIYYGGDATRIQSALTGGTFITLSGGSLRNFLVNTTAAPTAARNIIKCTDSCSIDHVGVIDFESGASGGNEHVSILADTVNGLVDLYYVNVIFVGNGTPSTAVKLINGAQLVYNNGWISDGGYSPTNGIWNNSDDYATVRNVSIGALYNASNFTADLKNDGGGQIYTEMVSYKTDSGSSIVHRDLTRPILLASPPFTCDAGHESFMYGDTSHAACFCDGSTWQKLTGSGAGACS